MTMADEVAIPYNVYRQMRAAFIGYYGNWSLDTARDHGYEPGSSVPIPDCVGDMLAWVWHKDHDQAAVFAAEYLAELRDHGDRAHDGPTVQFEDFLRGLPRRVPALTLEERRDMIDFLRREVPAYYGDGLES
jgi:hypothetical protein